MMTLAAVKPWHYWLGLLLLLVTVLAMVGTAIGYYWFVLRKQYHRS
jgi:hypothetical protein